MTTITIDSIVKEYSLNKTYYENITKQIKEGIKGRSCHHKVVLLSIIRQLIPIRSYLEIGVHNGTSMSYILSHHEPLDICIGIDLFEQTCEQYVKDKLSMKKSYENIGRNNPSKSPVHLIKGNSFNKSTFDSVKEVLGQDQIDILFIDGLHTFEGIRNDVETYSPLVKKGGLIILDDYEPRYPGIVKYVNTSIFNNPIYTKLGIFENNELILQKNT